ncbi:catalase [Chromatiaceae bacterium AAb-1]|nr:catalase [Chromatiaceae bacterium AAb-1]
MFKRSIIVMAISLSLGVQAAGTLTKDNGAPAGDNQNSTTAGPNGSVLLQDVHLIQKLQRFARERIPERVVHARGAGAYGEFVASADLSELTIATPFKEGKVTPVFVRFSSVVHGGHSPETLRDPRGFATKFYTDEGNWDLVGNNLPVFFIRDAIKFPDMVHSFKPNPVTNIQESGRFLDFLSHEPGSTHMLTWLFSDYGTPATYREMDGFGVHAFKFVNQQGEVHYVKFNWRSQQGVKNLDVEQAAKIQATDFNHLTGDLYATISAGSYPKWDLYIQTIKPEQLNDFRYNPLDATKIWPDVPEVKVGTMTLNQVPDNFFQESEQAALAPANLIPGIEPSEDRLLQGRIFSYSDTQLYRLGVNHQQLPVNRPRVAVSNYNQDGAANAGNTKSSVNYEPSRHELKTVSPASRAVTTALSGTVQQLAIEKQDNFYQAGELYRSFSRQQKANLISNLSGELAALKNEDVKYTLLSFFYKADADYGSRLTKAVKGDLNKVKGLAGQL